MMIDLGDSSTRGYDVKINGEMYRLREPNIEDTEFLESMDVGKNSLRSFVTFVTRLGLPSEVAKKLSVAQIKLLTEGLMPRPDEKKS